MEYLTWSINDVPLFALPENDFIENLPLMNTTVAMTISFTYIYSIMFIQRYMRKRNAVVIPKSVLLIHNFGLAALSAYMTWGALNIALSQARYKLTCNITSMATPTQMIALRDIIWIFYVSKIWEFLDTIFMALRKKNNQISTLHLYHHYSIFLIWNFNLTYGPIGEMWQSVFLNSLVHVIMYTYYGLSTLGIRPWWKRYITQFQMFQFGCFIAQSVYLLYTQCYDGVYVRLWATNGLYAASLLGLFVNFYVKSYNANQGMVNNSNIKRTRRCRKSI
jgi:hypothetical protein